jgi:hypothetical protein
MKVFNGIEWIEFESRDAAFSYLYPNGIPEPQPDPIEITKKDIAFCQQLKLKLLAAFKLGDTIPKENYRQLSDMFFYAKDAADNGNPTNLKQELLALPDESILGLAGWDGLVLSLVNEIDLYLNEN